MSRRLAARVRQLTFQRSLLGLPNIAQRVCCQLWTLVPNRDRHKESETSELLNPPTHMEIAIMLNISRETVTRVFQALQNRQIVRRDGPGRLQINNLKLLKELAEGKIEL
jgi:CRP-like cAMP-binding protein